MFFSLNKKFFFTIIASMIFCASIFLFIFNIIIGPKVKSAHSDIITRNQYVIALLNENISLNKELNSYKSTTSKSQNAIEQMQEELSRERKLNEELSNNYNNDYATITESLRIISIGASLTILSLIILWLLLHRWVIIPIDKLSEISIDIANGNFNKRFILPKTKFTDEFTTLMHTFNFMLDNIENNITEIKNKEAFLQNLIDTIPDAIRVIDENYNITLSNKAYTDYIKRKIISPSTKCYQGYDKNAQTPCNTQNTICPIKELRKKTNTLKFIHTVNNKPLSISCASITLENGTGIVESIRDLSDRITYSHQQKISSLGFLTSSLAHEIKNNLGAINLILDGIIEKYYQHEDDSSETKKYLTLISNQIKECIKVPERLLKVSKASENYNEKINVSSSINDILYLLDYEIKRKGINIIKNFSNIKENILGNETDFKMIILNLVQNAINATPNAGSIEIKTNTNKDDLLIHIKDNGCGIDEYSLTHIFEPFYTTAPNTNSKGTGLGLAIVKDLLSKFNGKIEVSSIVNSGSTFTITIPRQKKQKILVK